MSGTAAPCQTRDLWHTPAMHDFRIDPADEARHEPSPERFWNESYYFDFHRDDGRLGGYIRIGLYPALGVTWYWACLVGEGRPLVTLIEHGAPIPGVPGLDLQYGTLHATHRCARPLENFACALEGRAMRVADPAAVYGELPPADVDFALDLAWQTDGAGGYRFRDLTRYEIPCRVSGEIRVDDERIRFEGHGQRDHSWGERDWWATSWCWNAGRLGDGTRFHSVAPRTLAGDPVPWAAGYVQPAGATLEPIHSSLATEEPGPEGLPRSARIEVGELGLAVEPRHFSPVLLEDPDGRLSRFPRCLARYRSDDGREGFGWIEWNQPQPA